MSEVKRKPTPTGPGTAAVGVGVVVALAAVVLGPRLWDAMETSQQLTAQVAIGGFVVGALPTYLVMRRRAPK